MYAKREKMYPAYISKHNSNCEKQVLLLTIPNGGSKVHEAKSKGQRWCYYLAVKKLLALLRGIALKTMVIFIVFIRSKQKTNLNHLKEYVKIKIFVV